MKAIFPDCAFPDDCQCAARGYEHERTSCAVPRVKEALEMLVGHVPPAVLRGTNPEHLAEAYVHVAMVNHYLVVVAPGYTEDDLDQAEQILISRDNEADNQEPALNLALDLLEHDRRVLQQKKSRGDAP